MNVMFSFVNKNVTGSAEHSHHCLELVYRIAKTLEMNIDKNAAEAIFQGILSDTLGLTSDSVTAETFEIAAELTKAGAIIADLEERRREFMKKSLKTRLTLIISAVAIVAMASIAIYVTRYASTEAIVNLEKK